jgi:beta-glucosidase
MGTKALAGRNWEGFGADAYLQGILGGISVRGIQDQGVMANAKHFIGNEQETFRLPMVAQLMGQDVDVPVSSNIDDRSLHEVYGWPFMDLIHEGVVSVMCSYNEVNNTPACQNSYVLNKILKTEYGFPGFVMSDWGATKSGVDSAIAGLDMNMPGTNMLPEESGGISFFGSNLTAAVVNGTVPEERLDDMAIRILAAYFYVGRDEVRKEVGGPNFSSFTSDTYGYLYPAAQSSFQIVNKHVDARSGYTENVALDVALESSVLVKNNGALPVDLKKRLKKIGVVGVGARPPLNGPIEDYTFSDVDGAIAFGGGSGVVNPSIFVTPLEAINSRTSRSIISLDYYLGGGVDPNFERVVQNSDVNFIFGVEWSTEGLDRTNYALSSNVEAQILRAAELNSNNVVIITATGQVDVEKWIDHPNITAVLYNVPQGAYAGEAIARVLFGEYNPSGRLPFTVARNTSDYVPIVTNTNNGHPQDNFD